MENTRRKIANVETLETAQAGFANGISIQLQNVLDRGDHRSLNAQEKQIIIEKEQPNIKQISLIRGCQEF